MHFAKQIARCGGLLETTSSLADIAVTDHAQSEQDITKVAPIEITSKPEVAKDLCMSTMGSFRGDVKLNFASGKPDLIGTETFDYLRILVTLLNNECRDHNLVISWHTDSEGKESYNQWLTESRAKSVKSYLVKQGIEVARIEAVGFGELHPIASNETPEGKRQNRRIEFKVISK